MNPIRTLFTPPTSVLSPGGASPSLLCFHSAGVRRLFLCRHTPLTLFQVPVSHAVSCPAAEAWPEGCFSTFSLGQTRLRRWLGPAFPTNGHQATALTLNPVWLLGLEVRKGGPVLHYRHFEIRSRTVIYVRGFYRKSCRPGFLLVLRETKT